jgi:D-alanyl-D-alanine carboxypeptidase (penicillin-binding protein 5/6)
MAYGESIRSAAPAGGGGPRRVYRARRRLRPSALGVVIALIFLAAPLAIGHRLLSGDAQAPAGQAPPGDASVLGQGSPGQTPRTSVPRSEWPTQGQAAIVLGGRVPAASPHQEPAPIASLAKVMTAYLVLQRYPLGDGEAGFTMTVSPAQAEAVAEEADEGQSVVPVRAGERLTERQLLEALLIPSGNNIARMLAAEVGGGEADFVEAMNDEAGELGMAHTTYTDPSGFDPGTVSTAADQLRVFRAAMRYPVFRRVVSMESASLPVVGTVTNFNPLVDQGYAGKTGSDSAAGGCLAFFTRVTVGGERRTAVGVVMGQGEGSDTAALLGAAGEAAVRLTDNATAKESR